MYLTVLSMQVMYMHKNEFCKQYKIVIIVMRCEVRVNISRTCSQKYYLLKWSNDLILGIIYDYDNMQE